MKTPAYFVQVKTSDGFVKKSSTELRPGDIIVVQRTAELKPTESAEVDTDIDELRGQIPFGKNIPVFIFEKILKKNDKQEPPKLSHTADLMLIRGNAVCDESILTGESVPQAKEPPPADKYSEQFDAKKFKSSVIFAGCEILAVRGENDEKVLAVVLNTGFNTAKGKIAAAVLAEEDPVIEGRKDAYVLLFILFLVSIAASIYVLLVGLSDENRDKNKLFIRCIAIVTNVVPPELPMIMTIAVNSSVKYLKKKRIFCTEPFRIPAAGKTRICIFDKTGTLTKETLDLKGWATYDQGNQLKKHENWTDPEAPGLQHVAPILAGCQSLLELEGKLVGDPLEKLFFEAAGYVYSPSSKTAFPRKNHSNTIKIKKVFPFSSELRRMSTIAEVNGYAFSGLQLLVKGAPETIISLLEK